MWCNYLVLEVYDVHDLLEALLAYFLGGYEGVPLGLGDLENVPQPLGNGHPHLLSGRVSVA